MIDGLNQESPGFSVADLGECQLLSSIENAQSPKALSKLGFRVSML